MRRKTGHGVAAAAWLASATAIAAAPPQAIPLPARASPESISAAPDGTLYVGSTYGGVLRVRRGRAEPFVAAGAYGSRAVFGVLADARHGMLWLCSNDNAPGSKGDAGSWLKGFDLASARGKVSVKLPGAKTFCNDMAVGADGAVYVTNTAAPEILRLVAGGTALERWLRDPSLAGGLDGIAFGGDGNLYVNTFRGGELFRVAVSNGRPGAVVKLATSRPLDHPDALRPIGGMDFLMVEGGGRIDRVTIRGDGATIAPLANGLASPTGVDLAGGMAWYVNGQLSYFFDPAKRGQAPPEPYRIAPLPIAGIMGGRHP